MGNCCVLPDGDPFAFLNATRIIALQHGRRGRGQKNDTGPVP
jgi:hypothetical protein